MRVEWLSAGIEMEAYGDQAAGIVVVRNQFCYKSREEPSKKPGDRLHKMHAVMVGSNRGHLVCLPLAINYKLCLATDRQWQHL